MSPIVSISEEARARAQEFEKSGKKFVFFQRGEIDFPTPPFIVEAAKRGLDRGLTKYPKSGGEDFFKDAVIARLRADQDVNDLERGHVVATFGGQALGLYTAGEPAGFIGSLVGAIILLLIYRLVRRNTA